MRKTTRSAIAVAGIAMLTDGGASAATGFSVVLDSGQEVPPAGQANSSATASGTLDFTGGGETLGLAFDLQFDATHDFDPVLGGAMGAAGPGVPVDIAGQIMEETGEFAGPEVTLLHIHKGPEGIKGPAVYGMINPNTDDDADIVVTALEDGGFGVAGAWDLDEGAGTTLAAFQPDLVTLGDGEATAFDVNLHTGDDPAGAIQDQIVGADDLAAVPLPGGIAARAAGLAAFGVMRSRRA